MEKPTIGIKIADGSYFPILEEGTPKRKRLILTTVNDNQESVQIDLYKGKGNALKNAAYLGSLLIENIVQGPKESSEIELKIGLDKNGTLDAEAGDIKSGQIESLSVSMETLAETSVYDVPEFTLGDDSKDLNFDDPDSELDLGSDLDLDSDDLSLDEDDFEFDDIETDTAIDFDSTLEEDELSFDEDTFSIDVEDDADITFNEDDTPFDKEEVERDTYTGILPESETAGARKKKSGNPLLIFFLVIIAIAVIAGISYLIFRSLQNQSIPALESKIRNEQTEAAMAAESETDDTKAAAGNIEKSAEPVEKLEQESQKNDTTTTPEIASGGSTTFPEDSGVWYRIRWGDTLWGISGSFYDAPAEYNQIARKNEIKNPDIIFAETKIFIPSR